MIGYRKRSFQRAHSLLTTLRGDPSDLLTLKALQELLLFEIIHAENNIRMLKDGKKISVVKPETKRNLSYFDKRIEGFRSSLYIWRSFGDAIAFIYLDRFSLKQTFYNTENSNIKQSAGFIQGKDGLASEICFLDYAISSGMPILLSDLTNTIRHGDACLMGEPDPYLIEIKSSKKLDGRGKKQKRNIDKLHSFFETNESDNLRGYDHLSRQATHLLEKTYECELNRCINEAKSTGLSIATPEIGLHYIVHVDKNRSISEIIDFNNLYSPLIFNLNGTKISRLWAPYMPFILNIFDLDDLWDFIQGNIVILVICEESAFSEPAASFGYKVEFRSDETSTSLSIVNNTGEPVANVLEHMIRRIGLEFFSPDWIIRTAIEFAGSANSKYGADAKVTALPPS